MVPTTKSHPSPSASQNSKFRYSKESPSSRSESRSSSPSPGNVSERSQGDNSIESQKATPTTSHDFSVLRKLSKEKKKKDDLKIKKGLFENNFHFLGLGRTRKLNESENQREISKDCEKQSILKSYPASNGLSEGEETSNGGYGMEEELVDLRKENFELYQALDARDRDIRRLLTCVEALSNQVASLNSSLNSSFSNTSFDPEITHQITSNSCSKE